MSQVTARAQDIKFSMDFLGFEGQVLNIDFASVPNTIPENSELVGDTLVITVNLTKAQMAQVMQLNHLYFYDDAAIMKPESKYELDNLIKVLQESQDVRVQLNGHTNGNDKGRIYIFETERGNYFEILEDNLVVKGSAKKLSEQRAVTIKEYLVSNGIDESRLETKGWGGKQMLYDPDSDDAFKNVRVEVQIIN